MFQILSWLAMPFSILLERLEGTLPSNLFQALSRV